MIEPNLPSVRFASPFYPPLYLSSFDLTSHYRKINRTKLLYLINLP